MMIKIDEFKSRIVDSEKQYWFNGAWYNETDALKIINSTKVLNKLFDNYEEKMKELPKECFRFNSNMSDETFKEILQSKIKRGRIIIDKIYKVYNLIEKYYKLQGLLKGIEEINKDEFIFVNRNMEKLNKIYPTIPIDKFQAILRYYSKFNIPCANKNYKPLDEAINDETNYNLFEYVYCLSAFYKTKYQIIDIDELPLLDDDISYKTKQIYEKLMDLLQNKYIVDEDKSIIREIIYICRVIIRMSKKIRFIDTNINSNSYSPKELTIINEIRKHAVKSKELIIEYYNKLVQNYSELPYSVDETTINKLKDYLIEDILNIKNECNSKKISI